MLYVNWRPSTQICVWAGSGQLVPDQGRLEPGGGEGLQAVGRPALPSGQTPGGTPGLGVNLHIRHLLYRISFNLKKGKKRKKLKFPGIFLSS